MAIYTAAFLIAGLIALWSGGELMIKGASSLSLRIGLPIIVIGSVVLGFGTSSPELVVSLQAALLERGDITVGNVIGSNIANTGLILGISALIKPIPIKHQIIQHDGPVMLLTTLILCIILALTNSIGFWLGLLLSVGLAIFITRSITFGMKHYHLYKDEVEEIEHYKMKKLRYELLFIVMGLALLIGGGRFFLIGAINLAQLLNVNDAVIGVTIVALGTSLPELAISIIALSRNHGDYVIGNVVGSNIFNVLGVIGISALVHPIQITNITAVDYLYMMGIIALMTRMAYSGKIVSRLEGAILLALYCAYISYYSWV